MSRYSINDRIKFDMAVEKARLVKEAECEHGRRREKAFEWLRNTKRIFVEQRRLPFATMHFSSYKRTRARRRVR